MVCSKSDLIDPKSVALCPRRETTTYLMRYVLISLASIGAGVALALVLFRRRRRVENPMAPAASAAPDGDERFSLIDLNDDDLACVLDQLTGTYSLTKFASTCTHLRTLCRARLCVRLGIERLPAVLPATVMRCEDPRCVVCVMVLRRLTDDSWLEPID